MTDLVLVDPENHNSPSEGQNHAFWQNTLLRSFEEFEGPSMKGAMSWNREGQKPVVVISQLWLLTTEVALIEL